MRRGTCSQGSVMVQSSKKTEKPGFELDKDLVRQRFGKRAKGYDAVTPRQLAMGDALLRGISERIGRDPVERILELGAGTGRFTASLQTRHPGAQVLAIELSEEMIVTAAANPGCAGVEFRCADAEIAVEELAREAPFDLIVSNASVQWFADPLVTARAYAELLGEQGVLAFSTFGPATFCELRAAFGAADRGNGEVPVPRVLPFVPAERWRSDLANGGREIEVVEDVQVDWFDEVGQLIGVLRAAGATMANRRDRTPVTRAAYGKMMQSYRDQFGDATTGKVPATFEVLHVYLRRSADGESGQG